jgi:L-rhamnose isomerase/sugar isomerase
MKLTDNVITEHNQKSIDLHRFKFDFLKSQLNDFELIILKLIDFQIAIPSWALGNGGTRFGRFPGGGEPRNLEEKIEDVGLIHKLNFR